MNRQRILGGFSLVEMMLLLIIVSLMIASGVSVISKKHVKVPRLAMHGAYICYYNTAGRLHEEKYVGAGVSRKIWDENVDVCRFVPPDRASYFYVQAVAGGGAGGSANYDGRVNRAVVWSEQEVLSPFGFTNDLLKLKGISGAELARLGGTLWAFAKGDGLYGDAGDGGDIFYITKETGNCFAHREWTNTTDGRVCEVASTKYVQWEEEDCEYEYRGSTTAYGSSACNYWYTDDYWYSCNEYYSWNDNYCSGGTLSDPCPTGGSYVCDDWDSDWIGRYEGEGEDRHWVGWSDSYCYSSHEHHVDYDDCIECTVDDWYWTSCNEYYDRPVEATCSPRMSTKTVQTVDRVAVGADSRQPAIVFLQTEGALSKKYGTGQDAQIRPIIRDQADNYTICNYGNPSTYQGNNGIFGSCFEGFDCNFDCSTTALQESFGDGVLKLGSGSTSTSRAEEFTANNTWYPNVKTNINGKNYNGIYYDRSEDLGGIDAYGIVCSNEYGSGCTGSATDPPPSGTSPSVPNDRYNTNYHNPSTGETFYTKESIQTDCYRTTLGYETNSYSCNTAEYNGIHVRNRSCDWNTYSGTFNQRYDCPHEDKTGEYCMYGSSDLPSNKRYAYVVAMAEGEDGGVGKKCAFSSGARAGLQYKGDSSIFAGINGSDKNTTGAYKGIYCQNCQNNWPTWRNQPDAWAQDGTDSEGSATVKLGSNTCQIHVSQNPTKGRGACMKNNSGNPVGYSGADYTSCKHTGQHPKDGSFAGVGLGVDPPADCGTGHVGYCLVSRSGATKAFGKYTYKYSWARNNLAYGNPGTPGDYRSMVIRSFKDRDMIVVLGLGGEVGGCTGGSGGDTIIYSVPRNAVVDNTNNVLTDVEGAELMLQVDGGAGGAGCIPTPSEQLPYQFKPDPSWPSNSKIGDKGSRPNFNLKSNIMGLVLPLDDTVLGQWLSYSGASGDGGGSINNCWVSSWERYFEGTKVAGDVGYWTEGEVPCLDDYEDIPATPGIAGAVLIKW